MVRTRSTFGRKDVAGNDNSTPSSLSFTIDTGLPSVPSPLTPANGSWTSNVRPPFDWSDSTDATSGVYQYYLDVYDGDLTWGDWSTTTTVSNATPTEDFPYDRIYWRVKSYDRAGND